MSFIDAERPDLETGMTLKMGNPSVLKEPSAASLSSAKASENAREIKSAATECSTE
jgi:hypothetical protein